MDKMTGDANDIPIREDEDTEVLITNEPQISSLGDK